MDDFLTAAKSGDQEAFARLLEPFQRELRAHCYRMTGSLLDAEDLLQESLLRAWKGLPAFQGRSSLRTWLYRVSTNACLDLLEKKTRARVMPEALGPPNRTDSMAPDMDQPWLEPYPDSDAHAGSPEARYAGRQNVALAFLTALQLLPPKQRAVILLCDVIGLAADECAELLEQTTASINSALQRGRDTLDQRAALFRQAPELPDDATQALLGRYLHAWENADVEGLTKLLREDALLTMPPFAMWFSGRDAIVAALAKMVMPPGSAGSYRLRAVKANALDGFAAYLRDDAGVFRPRAIHLLELREGKVATLTAFLQPSLFPLFALPAAL